MATTINLTDSVVQPTPKNAIEESPVGVRDFSHQQHGGRSGKTFVAHRMVDLSEAMHVMSAVKNAASLEEKEEKLDEGLQSLMHEAPVLLREYFDELTNSDMASEEEIKEANNYLAIHAEEESRWERAKSAAGTGTNALPFPPFVGRKTEFAAFCTGLLKDVCKGLPKTLPLPEDAQIRGQWWKPVEQIACSDPNLLPFPMKVCKYTSEDNNSDNNFATYFVDPRSLCRAKVASLPPCFVPPTSDSILETKTSIDDETGVPRGTFSPAVIARGTWWKPYEEVDCEDPNTLPFLCNADPSELRSGTHADESGAYDGVVDRAAEDQMYQTEHNEWKLTDAERSYFEECKHLCSFKYDEKDENFDCSLDNTTLNVWEEGPLAMDLIAKDETLAEQDECLERRAKRSPLNEKQLMRRRGKMTVYFESKYGQKHPFNAVLLKETIKVVTASDIPGLLAKHRALDQAFYDRLAQIAEEQKLCLPWQNTFQVRPGKTLPAKVRKFLESAEYRVKAAENQTFVLFRGWKMPKSLTTPVPNVGRFASDKEVERSLLGQLAKIGESYVLQWTLMFQVRQGKPLPAKVQEFLAREAERLALEEHGDGGRKTEDVHVDIKAVEPGPEEVDEKAALMTEEEKLANSTPKIDKKMSEPAIMQPVPVAPLQPKVDAPPAAPVAKGPVPEVKPKKKKGFFSKLFGR
eukprot:Stramenopile-MAST_4_protein_2038